MCPKPHSLHFVRRHIVQQFFFRDLIHNLCVTITLLVPDNNHTHTWRRQYEHRIFVDIRTAFLLALKKARNNNLMNDCDIIYGHRSNCIIIEMYTYPVKF